MKVLLIFIFVVFTFTQLSMVFAQDSDEKLEIILNNLEENDGHTVGNTNSSLFVVALLKVFIALAIVIILLIVTVRFMQKISQTKSKNSWLQIIAYDSIGTNKGVCVVKIGKKAMVLGVTEQNINFLTELSLEEIEYLEASVPDGQVDNNILPTDFPFQDHLQENIKKIQRFNEQMKKNFKGDGNG